MRWFFAPISALFAVVSFIRWKLYRLGIFLHSKKAPAPVISVGNIALGGTGKTPCVIWLAKKLKDSGYDPVILTRGYGGKIKKRLFILGDSPGAALAGDEPALMSRANPDILIIVDRNRRGAANEAGAGQCRVFILDDGFQHLKLERDFDLVLLPASDPFSENHFFPWGKLRDGKWRLRETDAIVLVGEDPDTAFVERQVPGKKIFTAKRVPVGLKTLDSRDVAMKTLEGSKVIAFAGIGNPAGFRSTLESLGAEVVKIVRFRDHYKYTIEDIGRIEACAEEIDVDILVTTEKDAVRLAGLKPRLATYVLSIAFAPNYPEQIIELIENKLDMANT